jgi:RluA family pseudouridine synthase
MKLLHRDIERGAPWVKERNLSYLANVHRLDFETSGVLLLVKDKPSLVTLANQFGSEKPVKTYVAIAQGAPEQDKFEVDAKLAPHPVKLGQMRVDSRQGKKSITQFELRERYRGYSLLTCRPLTGRTHQIRIHLKYFGLPIAGDLLYGGQQLLLSRLKKDYRLKPGRLEKPLIERVALHAEELTVLHPVTNEPVKITAAWPKDLTVAVKYLRRYALPTGATPSSFMGEHLDQAHGDDGSGEQ